LSLKNGKDDWILENTTADPVQEDGPNALPTMLRTTGPYVL